MIEFKKVIDNLRKARRLAFDGEQCQIMDTDDALSVGYAIDDAIQLLKEQEPREWIYCEDDSGQDGYQCSGCGFFEPWYYDYTSIDFIRKYQFCPSCGAIMNAKYWKQREADDE